MAHRGEELVAQATGLLGLAAGDALELEQPRALGLDAPALADILEDDRHLAQRRRADATGINLEPSVEAGRIILITGGLAGERHAPV